MSDTNAHFKILVLKTFCVIGVIFITIFLTYNNYLNKYYLNQYGDEELHNKSHISNQFGSNNLEAKLSGLVFSGINNGKNPYEINSKLAHKFHHNSYHLEQVGGWYKFINDEILYISAKKGIINDGNKLINLDDGIKLQYANFTLYGKKLKIDLHNRFMESDEEISLRNQKSYIKANAFHTEDNGLSLHLNGNASAHFLLQDSFN